MKTIARAAVAAAVMFGLAATPAFSQPAPAPQQAVAAQVGGHWMAAHAAALADDAVNAWTFAQFPQGYFGDPLRSGQPSVNYGQDMLAYGMLRAAQRSGRQDLRDRAQMALSSVLPNSGSSAFRGIAAAYAYRMAPDAGLQSRWWMEEYLRRYATPEVGAGAAACQAKPTCYNNLKLLDALTVLVMTSSGVQSNVFGARLSDPIGSRNAAAALVNQRVPAVADYRMKATGKAFGRLRASTLSDPSTNPLAYHTLSTWMMAASVAELGPAASPEAHETLREALDALTLFMAPDGDMTYYGRGQGQVWAPAMAVAAAAEGARVFAATDPVRASRYLAVAELGLKRLQDDYRTESGMLRLVPGEGRVDLRGVDHYADSVTYNGLAVFALNMAADSLAQVPPTLAPSIAPTGRDMRMVDPKATGLAVVRKGDVWMAVHRAHTHSRDMRYDFGLLALKLRTPDGRWLDALAPRPITVTGRKDSAGPVLTRNHRSGLPHGNTIKVTSKGEVVIKGGFKAGSRWVARGVTFKYVPRRSGVQLRVYGMPRSGLVRMRVFTPTGTGSRSGRSLVAQGAFVDMPARASVAKRRGYHSGPVADLDAFDIKTRAGRGRVPAFTWRTY